MTKKSCLADFLLRFVVVMLEAVRCIVCTETFSTLFGELSYFIGSVVGFWLYIDTQSLLLSFYFLRLF